MSDLTILRNFYNLHKRSPSKRDIASNGSFRRKYGSWNAALEAAGLPVNRKFEHAEDELITSLQRFSEENGKSPTANNCNTTDYLFDTHTYMRKLGCKTWSQVLRKAGLEEYFEQSTFVSMPDDELLSLVELVLSVGNDTRAVFYRANRGKLPSFGYLVSRFGSWGEILKRLSIRPNMNKYSNEELISIFFEAKEHYGVVPSSTELESFSSIPVRQWTKRFGAYNIFLNKIGEQQHSKTPENVIDTDDELKQLYMLFSAENGFTNGATSKALDLSGDIYGSDVFSVRFGSINKLRKACGYSTIHRQTDKYTEEQIKQILRDLYTKLGRIPTRKDLNIADIPSVSTICRYMKTSNLTEVFGNIVQKTCTKCNLPKTLNNFSLRNRQNADGSYRHESWCKKCTAQSSYKKNREKKLWLTEEGKAYMREYKKTDSYKEYHKQYQYNWNHTTKGKECIKNSQKVFSESTKGKIKALKRQLKSAKKEKTKLRLTEQINALLLILANEVSNGNPI